MGPTWVLSAPDGPHVGPMNLAIRVVMPYGDVDLSQHSTGSDNGLLLEGTKPLPDPMLSNYQCGPLAFPWRKYQWQCLRSDINHYDENDKFQNTIIYTQGQWANLFWPLGSIWFHTNWSSLVQVLNVLWPVWCQAKRTNNDSFLIES